MLQPIRRVSLVDKTVSHLREAIEAGVWTEILPGEIPLVEQLGVSRRTLRAALRDLEAAGWLEARPGRNRRITRPPSPDVAPERGERVGFVLQAGLRESHPAVLTYLTEIQRRLQARGCLLEVHVLPRKSVAAQAAALEKLARAGSARAWILHSVPAALHIRACELGLRAVVSGTTQKGLPLPSVDSDHRAVARHATGLLLGKGHRRITMLLPAASRGGDLEAREGFLESIAPHAGGVGRCLPLPSAPHDCQRAFRKLLHGGRRPTAVIVPGLREALAACGAAAAAGLGVPRDLSLIALYHAPEMEYMAPPVNGYTHHTARHAAELCRLALALLHDEHIGRHTLRTLVAARPGGSVAPPPAY